MYVDFNINFLLLVHYFTQNQTASIDPTSTNPIPHAFITQGFSESVFRLTGYFRVNCWARYLESGSECGHHYDYGQRHHQPAYSRQF